MRLLLVSHMCYSPIYKHVTRLLHLSLANDCTQLFFANGLVNYETKKHNQDVASLDFIAISTY